MGRDRDPYERTLDGLRQQLRAGAFGHGQPLQILPLAAAMKVSSTPIREALARLAGEGLIERSRTGYLSLRHDATSLADLYRLDEVYNLAAVRLPLRRPAAYTSPSTVAGSYLARTESALRAVAPAASPALRAARENLWDRLAPFRSAEPLAIETADADLETLAAIAGEAEGAKALRAYFRRRERAAAYILEAAFSQIIK